MERYANLFKALADETRLRLLALLVEREELCVCDLMATLDLPQSTVSRHLATLRHSGLVSGRRQGVWMYYRLAVDSGDETGAALGSLLRHVAARTDQARADRGRLRAYLAAKEKNTCD